jgi:hypothetical protein
MLRNTSEERNARRNVYVIGVDGTSDDLDAPIMAVFGDAPFKHEHAISSVVCWPGLVIDPRESTCNELWCVDLDSPPENQKEMSHAHVSIRSSIHCLAAMKARTSSADA